MSSQNQIQIWVLPYPVHGHINPMLQFSKRLASKSQSLTLTFLLPTSKSNSFQPGSNQFPMAPTNTKPSTTSPPTWTNSTDSFRTASTSSSDKNSKPPTPGLRLGFWFTTR
ncbi:unnamed protein product [Rhodiola kirilowii]